MHRFCRHKLQLNAVLQGLRESLAAAGLAVKVIYSGGVDVDVLAQGAGRRMSIEKGVD
jgi:hypothetical protein